MSAEKNFEDRKISVGQLKNSFLEALKFIRDACFNIDIKVQNKKVLNEKEEIQEQHVSFLKTNEFKACVKIICENTNLEDEDSEKIIKCKVWMKSPLHSKIDKKWYSVQSRGDVIDYLILHLSPNLMFVRSMLYLKETLDFPTLSSEKQESLNEKIELEFEYNFEKSPFLQFLITNKMNNNVFRIWLVRENNQYVWIGQKNSDSEKEKLNSYVDYYNSVDLNESSDFLEHGFVNPKKIKNRCLHPSTIMNLRYILCS